MSLLIDLVFRRYRSLFELADAATTGSTQRDDGERGASLVEYSLLIALIAVVCLGAVTYFGAELTQSLSTSGGSIN